MLAFKTKLSGAISSITKITPDSQHQFEWLLTPLNTIEAHFKKVVDYFSKKKDVLIKSDVQEEDDSDGPIFKTFGEPTQDEVGFIIPLTCGHTQRPSDIESLLIAQHLN